jgi:hypothetical protein
MKTYARIENGAVAELLSTEADPAQLFHPALHWAEVMQPGVAVGWSWGPAGFAPPATATPEPAPVASLADLHARLVDLEAQVAALRPH